MKSIFGSRIVPYFILFNFADTALLMLTDRNCVSICEWTPPTIMDLAAAELYYGTARQLCRASLKIRVFANVDKKGRKILEKQLTLNVQEHLSISWFGRVSLMDSHTLERLCVEPFVESVVKDGSGGPLFRIVIFSFICLIDSKHFLVTCGEN